MVAPSIAALAINMLQLPVLLLFVHSPGDVNLYAFLALPFALAGVIFNFWYISLSRRHSIRSDCGNTLGARTAPAREFGRLDSSQTAVLIVQSSGIVLLSWQVARGDDAVGQYVWHIV